MLQRLCQDGLANSVLSEGVIDGMNLDISGRISGIYGRKKVRRALVQDFPFELLARALE